ncbi:hypothetical protein [Burkholderia sp. Bp8963]|uniref:hypothetical protein n=1 Tax=Burkholderia sp. Bp8963 TaxID=2184547 RepID=UPI000F5B2580|nr:hypothetical protein [Burkholderia sp. Bp8963]
MQKAGSNHQIFSKVKYWEATDYSANLDQFNDSLTYGFAPATAGINGPLLRTGMNAAKKLTKPKSTPNYSYDFRDSQGAREMREGALPELLFQDETKRNSESSPDYWH